MHQYLEFYFSSGFLPLICGIEWDLQCYLIRHLNISVDPTDIGKEFYLTGKNNDIAYFVYLLNDILTKNKLR